MNIFGESWTNYEEKVRTNWTNLIKADDTVILAGDFSWGMYLEETKEDFDYLESLPGRKIMLKGNHDYWWETLTKLNKFKEENNYESVNFLHNNFYETDKYYICGTSWICAYYYCYFKHENNETFLIFNWLHIVIRWCSMTQ